MYGGIEGCMIRLVCVWRELPNKNFVIRKRIRWRRSEIGYDSGRLGGRSGMDVCDWVVRILLLLLIMPKWLVPGVFECPASPWRGWAGALPIWLWASSGALAPHSRGQPVYPARHFDEWIGSLGNGLQPQDPFNHARDQKRFYRACVGEG